jgi:DNA-binding transcriptional regulator WhiA
MSSSRLTEAELDEFKAHIEGLFPADVTAIFKLSIALQEGTDKVVMQFPCADIFITNALSEVLHHTFKQCIELPVQQKNVLEKANVIFLKEADVKTISDSCHYTDNARKNKK